MKWLLQDRHGEWRRDLRELSRKKKQKKHIESQIARHQKQYNAESVIRLKYVDVLFNHH
jgi:hypothetical protein